MATPIENRMRAAAAAFAPLSALIGTNPIRWWDQSLVQGSPLPAVVVSMITDPPMYVFSGAMPTSYSSMQFILWADDADSLDTLRTAFYDFLKQFAGAGIPTAPAQGNFVTEDRDVDYPKTQPMKYRRRIQARIFNNSNL